MRTWRWILCEGQYHIFLHDCPCWNYRSNSLFIQGWGGEETRPETKISKPSQDMQPFLLAIFLFWQVYFSRIVCVTFEQDDVVTTCIKFLYCWWNIDLVSQGINGIFPLFFCSNKKSVVLDSKRDRLSKVNWDFRHLVLHIMHWRLLLASIVH